MNEQSKKLEPMGRIQQSGQEDQAKHGRRDDTQQSRLGRCH
jgi:hypothetical protein